MLKAQHIEIHEGRGVGICLRVPWRYVKRFVSWLERVQCGSFYREPDMTFSDDTDNMVKHDSDLILKGLST